MPEGLDLYGFSFIGQDMVYVNDTYSDDEQLYTELHEMGHLLSRSYDERVADRIAVFCCRLIEGLTGVSIDAEPLKEC